MSQSYFKWVWLSHIVAGKLFLPHYRSVRTHTCPGLAELSGVPFCFAHHCRGAADRSANASLWRHEPQLVDILTWYTIRDHISFLFLNILSLLVYASLSFRYLWESFALTMFSAGHVLHSASPVHRLNAMAGKICGYTSWKLIERFSVLLTPFIFRMLRSP